MVHHVMVQLNCLMILFNPAVRADGACRHLAAVLYEIESYMDKVKTCTDIPMAWTKKARQSDDPVEISNLVIKKAK